jgi:hypothetical protein
MARNDVQYVMDMANFGQYFRMRTIADFATAPVEHLILIHYTSVRYVME